jgi:hypothetical protein
MFIYLVFNMSGYILACFLGLCSVRIIGLSVVMRITVGYMALSVHLQQYFL